MLRAINVIPVLSHLNPKPVHLVIWFSFFRLV